MTEGGLLAKSVHGGRVVTLAGHSRDVATAFRLLFGDAEEPTRLADCWLRFFGLSESDRRRFVINGWMACALHDIGKANDGFQAALRGNAPQPFRHEHISALLLAEEPVRGWLERQRRADVDRELITAAVVSHHLKVSPEDFARPRGLQSDPAVVLYGDAPDVRATLDVASEATGVDPPSGPPATGQWRFQRDIAPRRERFRDEMHTFGRSVRRDERRRRLLLAVKAAVIAADSAGSAATRLGIGIDDWLRDSFGGAALTAEDIESGVIGPRVREMQARGRWRGFHDFQVAAATLDARALLLSGCGSGKTLAAWKWAAAQLAQRPASRVLFLYPTRATATEGFRDYVSWTGAKEAALMSGTARYDLDGMFGNPDESMDVRAGGDFTTEERLFALGYWGRRVFSATADSFLAMIANRYAALCMTPLLCDSVVVVDEVHSFDRSMFKALDNFLAFFDVPVLCMTASLPRDRLRILREQRELEVFPREIDSFPDLDRQANAPRYRVIAIDAERAAAAVAEAIVAKKRVMWVVNTVQRCQEAAQEMRGLLAGDVPVLCYHSRFRLEDRRGRHEAVIAAFREAAGPLLLVTTQVCEMSLDLDADVLITESAPIPSLIQRMGRCCREPLPRPGRLGEVSVYEPEGAKPYEPTEVSDGLEFAHQLEGEGTVSQARLAELLEEMEIHKPQPEGGFSGFLDSGWYAMSRDDSFREDNDYTVDAVLDSERDRWLELRARKSPDADGLIVPVPRRRTREDSALGQFVRVAEARCYDRVYGYQEERNG